MSADDKVTIIIVFKSGAKVQVRCSDWKLTKNQAEKITSLTLTGPAPRNLFIALDEIAAIFEEEDSRREQ